MRLATFYGPEMRPTLAPAILLIKYIIMKFKKYTVMVNKQEI